jgi:hypothetical protein
MVGRMAQVYVQPQNHVTIQQLEEKLLKAPSSHKKHNKLNLQQLQYKYLITLKTFQLKS